MAREPALGLVLDCHDPEALAPFWAAALGYVSLGSVENYVLLLPDGRLGPKLLLQRVPEDKAGRTECTSTSRCQTSRDWLLDSKEWAPSGSGQTW